MEDSKIIYTKTFEITKSNSVTIQISNFKGKDLLNIYKSSFSDTYTGIVKNNSIAFTPDQLEELKNIISDIPKDYEIKEYGMVGKYKLYISTFNGNNSFQIREWVESETYTGYGKKGVSISMNKFDEFKLALFEVLDMFEKYLKGDLQLDSKKVANDDEIESYF
ncbi:hypothetical protein HUU51_00855 [Candidatus Gracilibacteria bacterium]|nr:hypothetical protein [Candidatus Gracilibacteria bacterium]